LKVIKSRGERQEAKGERHGARGERQEERGKRREARGERQEAKERGKRGTASTTWEASDSMMMCVLKKCSSSTTL
jgi:hypothetical protein